MTSSQDEQLLRRLVVKSKGPDACPIQNTYSQIDTNDSGGRWAKPVTQVGSKATTQYPRSNLSEDISGIEPPFGISVSDPIVTGEYEEIQASLRQNQPQDLSPPCVGDGATGVGDSTMLGSQSPTPTLRRKKLR